MVKSISEFLASLELLPWFTEIGKPILPQAGVKQIFSWEEWPGPEVEEISELSLFQQTLYDDILDNAGDQRDELCELWARIHEIVFRVAAPRIPYDAGKDSWHGPTTAVWQAAWTAALIGWLLLTGRSIPNTLQEQWEWFLRGHWPCGYSVILSDDRAGPLLVF